MITDWTCTAQDASTTHCVTAYIQASSTPVATTTIPYGDWLYVNGFIIFLLAFVPISMFFNLISRKR